MSKRGCHFCIPAKARIYKMQKAGMSDQQIIDTYKKEFGDKIYLADPSSFFWLTPTMVIFLGGLGIFYFLKRIKKPVLATAAPVNDPTLDRYRDEMDKELSKW